MRRWAISVVVLIGVAAVGVVAGFALSRWYANRHESASVVTTTSPAIGTKAKQLWTCGMHPQVIQDHPGNCPICHMRLTPMRSDSSGGDVSASQPSRAERKILYWWDPMLGPASISDKPGKSAMNMDLVPVYEDSASGGPQVKIDPTVVQNMGIRTAEVTRGPLTKTIRTVGMLRLPDPGMHDVSLKVSGWIEKLYADKEGMHVHEGEPLFDLYSPDLQVAAEELIGAERALQTLDANADASVRKEAEGLVASAKRKLALWDVAPEDIEAIAKTEHAPKTITFRSPATGHLEEKMIVQGSAVQAGMKLLRIADHSTMWLEAQVYEDQIPLIALGQMAEMTVEAMPGKAFKGPIIFMYPHLDNPTRTLRVRIALDNPDFALKPGMYATANIVTQPVADAIQVPREAVIDTGTRQIAFVSQPEGHFDPRKVRMGVSGDNGRVQILEGLAPGETVVTSGQFLLDVESRTTEAIQKLRQTSTLRPSAQSTTQPAAATP